MAEFNCAVSEGESGAAVLDQSADHPANQLPVSSGTHLPAGQCASCRLPVIHNNKNSQTEQ